jgi:hypothetical protein
MALFRRRRDQTPPPQPPVEDLATATVEVDGHTVDLARVLVGARIADGTLEVSLYHPLVESLPAESRRLLARRALAATLGEPAASLIVRELHPAEVTPIDCFDLAALRAFVDGLRR